MFWSKTLLRAFVSLILLSLMLSSATFAQKKSNKKQQNQQPNLQAYGKPVMWERVNVSGRDLYWGPGGREMQPDLSRITYIREEKQGHNKKYRIRDGAGRTWVAKLGREAQPETAAVRLLWALGYKTEINYLVPTITIPGKGTFKNVRLEARPDEIDRLDEWKWKDNPFIGTNELQGLKIMMVFMTNWDVLDKQNKILLVDRGNGGKQVQYIVSDLGATFGKLGNNNFPIIYRLGRKTGNPEKYISGNLVKGAEYGLVKLAYKGKNRDIFKNISVLSARWLADLLLQLSDKQIEDAFRAANYAPNQIALFKQGVRNRIAQLHRVADERNLTVSK